MSNDLWESSECPTLVYIMPDYGPCYASDDGGGAFNVSDCFKEHPKYNDIKEIEDQIYGLTGIIDSGLADHNPNFPWEEFDHEAEQLTEQLAEILIDEGVTVIYRKHYNNPFR